MANDKKIESKVLLSIHKQRNEEHGKGMELRVIDWIVGDKHYPQLEKRETYRDQETGTWKNGKSKGLNKVDFVQIIANWPAVCAALGAEREAIENFFARSAAGEAIPGMTVKQTKASEGSRTPPGLRAPRSEEEEKPVEKEEEF